MMITTNSRLDNKDLPTEQDGTINGGDKAPAATTSCSLRLWPAAGLKNPRIVRVSRALGGKDRHSKVSTVRGLRDRRVRLSVPTAIQLYDLQDRLGVNQPSKVVEWLLGAAHREIDKLPPLHLVHPQGSNLAQYCCMIPQSALLPHSSTTRHDHPPPRPLVVENEHGPAVQSTYWSTSDIAQIRSKQHGEYLDGEDGHSTDHDQKGLNSTNYINGRSNADHDHHVLPKVLAGPNSFASSYYHWELATNAAYLSQFGIRTPSTQAVEAPPPPWPLPPVPDSQILLRPQGPTPSSSSMFPSYFYSAPTDFDAKQFMIQTQTANSAQSRELCKE